MASSKVKARFLDDIDGDFTDLDNLSPIAGLKKVEIVSIEEAVDAFLPAITSDQEEMASFVSAAKKKARLVLSNRLDPLNINEIAAINLYTQETPVYRTLNAMLRKRDRNALRVWFPYLKLLLTAVHKLKPISTTVFRGVKLDLSHRYQKGGEVVWWSFSSATQSIDVLQNPDFLGEDGERTLFIVNVHNVINVRPYSAIAEDERLMLPGIQLFVKGVLNQGNGLTWIQLEEDKDAMSLIPGFGFAESSSAVAVAVVADGLINVQTKVYSDGGKYVGEMKNGKRNGRGTFFFTNNSRYKGEYKDGKKHGQGTFFYANKDRYEGDWKDDKRTGEGTYIYANGNRYKGDWEDDNKHGKGTYFFANGDRYEGDWKDDKEHGQGKISNKQGHIMQHGRYENDNFVG